MTPSQKARLIGINASLRVRGVSVLLGVLSLKALVNDTIPDGGQFVLNRDEGAATYVSVLRSALGATRVDVGDTFECDENECSYRVTMVESRASDILATFKCETVKE